MKQLIIISFAIVFLFSCKEKAYIYGITDLDISQNNADKNKEKSPEQFINIVYANLFQEALSPNNLVDITEIIKSIGDKQIAYETVIARMMADSDVKLPLKQEMLNDVETFVNETYERFYVRIPSESEKTWWKNYINSHPNLTPELIYFSFATSNEYYFY